MPKSLKRYTDPMKAREYRNRQRKINYDRCPGDPTVSRSRYTEDEERLIAGWKGTDRELSAATGRGVRAIQIKRHRMRKEGPHGDSGDVAGPKGGGGILP